MTPVIFGLSGLVLTNDERALFADANPAGYIIFKRNILDRDQLRALTDDSTRCQRASRSGLGCRTQSRASTRAASNKSMDEDGSKDLGSARRAMAASNMDRGERLARPLKCTGLK